MSAPLVELTRNGVVEAIHRGDIAVVNADGELLASVGEPTEKITYWRSAAKPFQALPVIYTGAAERGTFSAEELALVAGSHNGEPVHVRHAAALLERAGCRIADLKCGIHPPLDARSAADLLRAGVEPTVLHNNCSGKHIGMLAVAAHLGVDAVGYRSVAHPVQQHILDCVCEFAGLPAEAVTIGVDGCGVPCFGTSVYRLAYAFARLMSPAGVVEPFRSAASVVTTAMARHPYLVAGRNRVDTDLMRVGQGNFVAKGGASGVQCVGVRGGIAVVVKIENGTDAPTPVRVGAVAALAALHQLGLLSDAHARALSDYVRPALRTVDGDAVGGARPQFQLDPLSADLRTAAGEVGTG